MARFNVGDRVRVIKSPSVEDDGAFYNFVLGKEGTVTMDETYGMVRVEFEEYYINSWGENINKALFLLDEIEFYEEEFVDTGSM